MSVHPDMVPACILWLAWAIECYSGIGVHCDMIPSRGCRCLWRLLHVIINDDANMLRSQSAPINLCHNCFDL